MQKILFVCLGNICRSPLAEGIMLHLIDKHNLNWTIDSAGTANYHVGEAPDRRTIANAKKNGVDLSSLRARQFKTNDFDDFDRIFVMDKSNLQNVLKHAKHDEHKSKVDLFLNVLHPDSHSEVPDPYYGTEHDFEQVFQLVYKACEEMRMKYSK
ncbi:MAG: low molecular weight phosphotyrosine protein phosphatase [Bacteroidia bacterium]|jgi:protein-tyrosine phosphatase|nr:low molecular weight phosphotyrosine protein phosphatase [Bacteroidia bacterium]